MAAQENALDIPEPQVAVDFPDDQFFTWHVRVLVTQLGDGGRWVAFSPDLEPEVIDLADHRVVPLVRDAVFPQRIRGDVYYRVNITEDDLTNTVQECRALAAVLGVTGPSRPTTLVADWVYADPAFDRFGEVVDSSLTMIPATMLSRDSVALVRVGADDGGPRRSASPSPTWTCGRTRSARGRAGIPGCSRWFARAIALAFVLSAPSSLTPPTRTRRPPTRTGPSQARPRSRSSWRPRGPQGRSSPVSTTTSSAPAA